jgi:hypothetical protein
MSQTLLTRLARLEASRTTQKEALIIVGADQDECDARLKQAESSRQTTERKPLFILTGVPRNNEASHEQDPVGSSRQTSRSYARDGWRGLADVA